MICVESFLVILFSLIYYGNTAKIGESCTISISESPGICKLGSDCPVVEQDAKQGIDPTLCEFYELIRPVVCCPIDEFLKDKDNITMVKPQSLLLPDRHTKRLCEKIPSWNESFGISIKIEFGMQVDSRTNLVQKHLN